MSKVIQNFYHMACCDNFGVFDVKIQNKKAKKLVLQRMKLYLCPIVYQNIQGSYFLVSITYI